MLQGKFYWMLFMERQHKCQIYTDRKKYHLLFLLLILVKTFSMTFYRAFPQAKVPKTANKKILGLPYTCIRVVKNCKILTFKFNFLCQNYPNLSKCFFNEQYQFRNTFLVIDIF